MKITAEQLAELQALIADHFTALVVNVVSPAAVSKETLDRLREMGLVDPKVESIRDAYLAGIVAQQLDQKGTTLTLARARKHLEKNPIALSEQEMQAIRVAQMSAGNALKGLGDRVRNEFGQKVLTTNRKALARAERYREKVRSVTARAIENRKSVGALVSDIGHAVKDWTRDLQRISGTESTSALNQGRLGEAVKKDGAETRVYFIVHKNACEWCRGNLLHKNGVPIIFKASEIAPAGSNVGLKKKNWVITSGAQHPNCGCVLTRCAPGLTLNQKGELVVDDGEDRSD